jgi:hypothetical protein
MDPQVKGADRRPGFGLPKHNLLHNQKNKDSRWPAMAETIVFSSGIQAVIGKLLLLYFLSPYNILIIR